MAISSNKCLMTRYYNPILFWTEPKPTDSFTELHNTHSLELIAQSCGSLAVYRKIQDLLMK